jgi:hypothetical protein
VGRISWSFRCSLYSHSRVHDHRVRC